MGCGSTQTVESSSKKNDVQSLILHEAILSSDLKFRDMEETKSGTFIGEGIKRIPNYKCTLPYDKLDELREQFWLSQKQNDPIWPFLKICSELDSEQAEGLIALISQTLLNNCLRDSYQKSHPNYVYHIPNFCIGDPLIEKDFENYEKMYDGLDELNIRINVYYYEDKATYTFKLRNKCTGFDLKHKFCQLIRIDKRNSKIRVFYKGQEIKDDHCLYYYSIQQDSTLLAICASKEGASNKKSASKKARAE